MTKPAIPLSVLIEAHKALEKITDQAVRLGDAEARSKAVYQCAMAAAGLGSYLRTITAAVPVEVGQ